MWGCQFHRICCKVWSVMEAETDRDDIWSMFLASTGASVQQLRRKYIACFHQEAANTSRAHQPACTSFLQIVWLCLDPAGASSIAATRLQGANQSQLVGVFRHRTHLGPFSLCGDSLLEGGRLVTESRQAASWRFWLLPSASFSAAQFALGLQPKGLCR